MAFQESGDALQEEPQLSNWANVEIPKVILRSLHFLVALKHVTCRFSEFVDYVLGKDLRYDDEHWAPFFKECTPCHINFTFIGQYMFLDTWEWPVDEDAFFHFSLC